MHHVARLDIARDEGAGGGRDDIRVLQPHARRFRGGACLRERRRGDRSVAAAARKRSAVAARAAQLRVGEVERLLRIVERSLADEALPEEVGSALAGGARVVEVHLCLAQRLLGDRVLHLVDRAQPELGLLATAPACSASARTRALEPDQGLAGRHGLSFDDRDSPTLPTICAAIDTR